MEGMKLCRKIVASSVFDGIRSASTLSILFHEGFLTIFGR